VIGGMVRRDTDGGNANVRLDDLRQRSNERDTSEKHVRQLSEIL
jgi:hypothetical protein